MKTGPMESILNSGIGLESFTVDGSKFSFPVGVALDVLDLDVALFSLLHALYKGSSTKS